MKLTHENVCFSHLVNDICKRTGNICNLFYDSKNAAPDVGLEPTTLGLLEHDWLAM